VWGKRDAPVTVVIFSDFECPFCSRVEPTLDQVKQTYGPDKVRLVWKNEPLPFHQKARPAAEAAQAVFLAKGSDAFWKFHDTAFKNQKDLSPDILEKWAVAAGVDSAKFKEKLKVAGKKVDEDHEIAKKSGINGTPGFLINGVLLSGAQPFEKFKTVIDEELGKAQKKIAAGTPKDKVYVEMSKDNKKNAPAPKDDDEGGEKEDDKTVFNVPIGNSPILGEKNAPVTIVIFSDFECPFCGRVEPTLKDVRTKYGNKVRLVWKNEPLPFHKRARPAAELALEARAEKNDKGFWDAHDKLFENQKALQDADLEKYAGELGLNVEKVKAAIKDDKYKKDIDADTDVADDVQASGTPHFFINGRRLVGAQPKEKFEKVIDEEIKKTGELASKGIAPEKMYDTLMKEAKSNKKIVAVPPSAPWKGGDKAKVVIQIFSDFQCPFCGRVEPTLADVQKAYGDKIKFVWRDKPLPFHKDAPLAAQAAREAYKQKGNDGFWKMHDMLFANQSKPDGIKREALDGYAKELGLDMAKFKNALDNEVHKAAMDVDDKAATEAGVNGTPHFNINGYSLSGAQPIEKFKKVIDRALAEANQK
jgi:protein-disulfide isomerase